MVARGEGEGCGSVFGDQEVMQLVGPGEVARSYTLGEQCTAGLFRICLSKQPIKVPTRY